MSTSPDVFGDVPQWTLGDRLAKALDHAGMSHQDMAQHLGVSRNTVGNYCADRVKVSRATLMAWSAATGVSLAWLESGVIAPAPSPPGRPVGSKAANLDERRARRYSKPQPSDPKVVGQPRAA